MLVGTRLTSIKSNIYGQSRRPRNHGLQQLGSSNKFTLLLISGLENQACNSWPIWALTMSECTCNISIEIRSHFKPSKQNCYLNPHISNDSVASGARVGDMRIRADFVRRRRVETLRGRQNRADSLFAGYSLAQQE